MRLRDGLMTSGGSSFVTIMPTAEPTVGLVVFSVVNEEVISPIEH